MRQPDSRKGAKAESAGAEQGCRGQASVDVTHSWGPQESQPYSTHVLEIFLKGWYKKHVKPVQV